VASYNSSRFLILLGTSDEDADDGVDDDPSVFLLLNIGDLRSSKQHYPISFISVQLHKSMFCSSNIIGATVVAPDIAVALKIISSGTRTNIWHLVLLGEKVLFKESPPSIMVTKNLNWST
jgi:hypothetical protein